ncbi:hypothetical protein DFH06DRAFT_1344884 [Mycena polygramma]|nr:hypothetical protein DFH06DRAFT_1344884 [Mycena polygramma]
MAMELRHEKDGALEAALQEYFAERDVKAKELAKASGRSEKFILQVMQNGVKYTNKRAPSLKNAIAHRLSKQAKERGEDSNVLDVQLTGAEYEAYKQSLSKTEKDELIAELEEDRKTKAHGVRATNRAAAVDATQTSHQAGRVLFDLHERTGVRGFAMFTRGNIDDSAQPSFVDSGDARDFFQEVFQISYLDIVRRFEMWSTNKSKTERKDLDAARKEIGGFVRRTLRKATGEELLKMAWCEDRYKVDIVHRFGVELAGWPTSVPIMPLSKIHARELREILDKVRRGGIHWVVLTAEQREEVAEEVEEIRESGALKTRKERCDKNKLRGPRSKKNADIEGSDSDDSDTDADKDASDTDKDDSDTDKDEDEVSEKEVRPRPRSGPRAAAALPAPGPVNTSAVPQARAGTSVASPAPRVFAPTPSHGAAASAAFTTPQLHGTSAFTPTFAPPFTPAFAPPSTPAFMPASTPASHEGAGNLMDPPRAISSSSAAQSQPPSNAGFNFGFVSMDDGLSLDSFEFPAHEVEDFISGGQAWRLNTSNREEGRASGTEVGGYSSNAIGVGSEPLFSSLPTFTSSSAVGANAAVVDRSHAGHSYHIGAGTPSFSASYTRSTPAYFTTQSTGVVGDQGPAGGHSAPAPTGAAAMMSVFALSTNTTGSGKRARGADGDGDSEKTRKKRKKAADGEGSGEARKQRSSKTTAVRDAGGDAPRQQKKQKKSAPDAARA